VFWRQGTRGGGEPADPVVSGDYVFFALSDDGMFVVDKRTGNVEQYFDPGFGISAKPAIDGDMMYVLSNRGILYALNIDRF
jgi:outer membrane protein assembly factor BamB